MEQILKEFNNVEKTVRRNNFTVLGLIILMIVMVITFAVALFKINAFYANNRLVINNDGYVHKASMVSEKEALEIEIKDFMVSFFHTYYTFNQYTIDKNINLGLYKGDESLRDLYVRYKDNGWYNVVIQQNIDQITEPNEDGINVDVSTYPYRVAIHGKMILRKGDAVKSFTLSGTCFVKVVSRDFPKNPHGLFITNWTESKTEINN